MSADARFWQPLEGGKVRCTLCPHACVVEDDRDGICKARGNRGGRLVSLVHGHPATAVSDEIEKKPFYHFHPGTRVLSFGTLGCNVLCVGCPTWQLSHATARNEADKLPKMTPSQAVAMALKHKLPGIAWTYNEPTVWVEWVHDVAVAARAAGLFTAFVTAGFMSIDALDYVAPVLDALKYDLKAPDGRGWSALSKVKDPTITRDVAVRAQQVHGLHVEVVSNVVPGINDDETSLRTMAQWVHDALGPDTPWHVTRFQPDFELSHVPATSIKTLEQAAAFGRTAGLRFVYIGNVPGHAGRNTICPQCGRTAIHRGDPGVVGIWVRDGLCEACGEDLHVVHCAR
jgi:pyruvate formate lyase activating enzyme